MRLNYKVLFYLHECHATVYAVDQNYHQQPSISPGLDHTTFNKTTPELTPSVRDPVVTHLSPKYEFWCFFGVNVHVFRVTLFLVCN